ncbi:MAG: carboxypeptidase-like regulatory domain-containing protein [Methanomassiliicoccales archaeon]
MKICRGALLIASIVSLLVLAFSTPAMAQEGDVFFIIGRVLDDKGMPLASVNITATNTTTGTIFSSYSNSSGAYNISLPAGVYNISASLENYRANITYLNVVVGFSTVLTLNFTMSEILGCLSGHVTNGTAPVVGAIVYLKNEQYNYSGTSISPLGEYTITGIAPGVYVAYAEKQGYWTNYSNKPIFIVRGVKTILNFTLLEQPAKIFGTVYMGDVPIPGVQVIVQAQSFSTATMTDSNGNYTITGVPAGSYTVTFRKAGYQEKIIQISLSPFENKRLDFFLEKEAIEESTGFIPGFDLPHSLMVVALAVAIVILIISLFVKYKVARNPGLLAEEEVKEEKKETEEKEVKPSK